MEEFRKAFKLSDKLLYSRGLSCVELNRQAGIQVATRDKSKEELVKQYKQILLQHRGIRKPQAAKLLGVSIEYLDELGIKASDIRRATGIACINSLTKEEWEARILVWLKTQPVYCGAALICKMLHCDFACVIQKYHIDVVELNRLAGHTRTSVSWFEDEMGVLLVAQNIRIERQKTFDGCVNKRKLRFDYWLPDYAVLIEVDGTQHSIPNKMHNMAYIRKTDAIKNRFAVDHGIFLYRIQATPSATFKDRAQALINEITGTRVATPAAQTTFNCGYTLVTYEIAMGHPQPSKAGHQANLF